MKKLKETNENPENEFFETGEAEEADVLTITHPKKRAMLEALENSMGIVTTAIKSLNAQGVALTRRTHYLWMEHDKDYRAEVNAIDGINLDFSETFLFKSIKEGNIAACIFHLKCRGKSRGYVEHHEFEHNIGTTAKRFILELEPDEELVNGTPKSRTIQE